MVLYEHLCLAVLTGDGDVDIVVRKYWEQVRIPGDYSFSTYSKSSTKLTLPLIPMCAYQRVRNNSFSKKVVYLLDEWSQNVHSFNQMMGVINLSDQKSTYMVWINASY